jgi:hypothetical protein
MTQEAKAKEQRAMMEMPNVSEDVGAAFRYRVESRSADFGCYLVDMTDRGGLGSCSCHDFSCRANPNWKRHGTFIPYPLTGRVECRHVAACREYLYETVVIPMLAKMRAGIPKPETDQ